AGDVDGRRLQESSAATALDPVDVAAIVAFHEEFETAGDLAGAMAERDRFLRRGFDQFELKRDQLQSGEDVAIDVFVLYKKRLVRTERGAAVGGVEERKKVRSAFTHREENSIELLRRDFLAMHDSRDIPNQLFELIIRNRHSEILAGHFFDVVRFIK